MNDVAVSPTSGGLSLVDATKVVSMLTQWVEADRQLRRRVVTLIA
jgi:hypothetical protein